MKQPRDSLGTNSTTAKGRIAHQNLHGAAQNSPKPLTSQQDQTPPQMPHCNSIGKTEFLNILTDSNSRMNAPEAVRNINGVRCDVANPNLIARITTYIMPVKPLSSAGQIGTEMSAVTPGISLFAPHLWGCCQQITLPKLTPGLLTRNRIPTFASDGFTLWVGPSLAA